MEVVAAITLGYLLLGLQKIAADLRAHPVDRPGWARQPSLKMACLVGLLWWWASFRAPHRMTARTFARALLSASSRLATASGFVWGWYAAWGFVLTNTLARVIAAVVSFAVLSPFLAPVLALISMVVGLVVVAPIGAIIDFVLREDDPIEFDTKRTEKEDSRSAVSTPKLLENTDVEDDRLEHEAEFDDEVIEGETVAQKEHRLLAELDALESLARASRPWTGTTSAAESGMGNSARVLEEEPQNESLQGLGSGLAKIVTTLNANEATNPTGLWGRIQQAKPRIGPSACRFEVAALRMAAVMAAIEDVILDGLDVADELLDAYEKGLLVAFTESSYAKQVIASGHATDPDDLLALGYAHRQIYLEAAKAPGAAERHARIMVEFESRCAVEPGTIGLAAPHEFELLREFAGRKLRGSIPNPEPER